MNPCPTCGGQHFGSNRCPFISAACAVQIGEQWIAANRRIEELSQLLNAARDRVTEQAQHREMFWPSANETQEHLYEIRNGRNKEYVLEHAKALTDAADARGYQRGREEVLALVRKVREFMCECGDVFDSLEQLIGAPCDGPYGRSRKVTMKSQLWWSDEEYKDKRIESVNVSDDGSFTLTCKGWSLWVAPCGFIPKVGQTARFFGRGIGFPVRGLVIAGQLCYYRTADEQETIRQAQSDEFDRKAQQQEADAKAAGRDEVAMRAVAAPTPESTEALTAYIAELTTGPHTYGTSVYAMSLAATATFNFVASALGCTGFQASCANLDIVRRTLGIDGPFMLVRGEDLLYPQYDLRQKIDESIEKWQPWVREQAQQKLSDARNADAHPSVRAHWQKLAGDWL